MKKQKKNKNSSEDFEIFYSEMHGERWEDLKKSFLSAPAYYTLSEGLLKNYYLDEASLYPVEALDITGGQTILDMCAAPGGKTLLIALKNGPEGSITANDRSPDRRNRLIKVIEDHLPEDLASTITVTGYDAAKWGLYEKNLYDRILLDAPCSSERHVYNSPSHMEQWSRSRTKRLSERQFAMLASALEAVKPGGRIVYSTCSISDFENDKIIEKLFRKRNGLFRIIKEETDIEDGSAEMLSHNKYITAGENTEYGKKLWPDKKPFAGPIFYTIIEKTE